MGIPGWIANRPRVIREEGFQEAVSQSTREARDYLLQLIDAYDSRGTRIYDIDWDTLIVLDGCRVDVMESVADEYDFLPDDIPVSRSLGSTSRTWMDRNFTDEFAEEMQATTHVTGNPYSKGFLDPALFRVLDEVWEYGWDDDIGTVPGRTMTDRAIDASRTHDHDRLIVHYMQPHFPSIPDPLDSPMELERFGRNWNSVWDRLRDGDIDRDTVWDSYRENLRYVLDDVELLLENTDGERVIITADHGNAFGEWGLYGHPPYSPIAALREVPWVETTSSDTETYEPTVEREDQAVAEDEVQARLESLGYV